MNTDRHEQYEEQVQFLDSAEALQDYFLQQARHALVHLFEQERSGMRRMAERVGLEQSFLKSL